MKNTSQLYISADMEGVAGVVSASQTVQSGFEYELARKWMTQEVAVVSDAAISLGVERVVVSDSHGNGQNLLLDELPVHVDVVRNWPRPLGMMQGVEDGMFIGSILLGHHCGAESKAGILAHTFAGLLVTGMRVNGKQATETTINHLISSHYQAPIIMASGDAAYVDYIESEFAEVSCVTTKQAYGRQSALTRNRSTVLAELKKATLDSVESIMSNPKTIRPISGPLLVEVDFQRHAQAELLAYLPGVERMSGLTIRYEAADAVALSKFIMFITNYQASND